MPSLQAKQGMPQANWLAQQYNSPTAPLLQY
eukprot:CAMPEP_0202906466 /NCGR_PEP_ID=MMETSP1392-20130828/39035_1 /ASSEMBLY_ACC=CAM_ASM_000868 /TAXON_ID=225041 /ORGANISM="Chlamydomonas chlamydogama, Strain SAG 11-48b" /LENGTH=30 /DNA_ID= /DNA_START= /DNA_END= /DNA_ORIENTATION=